MEVKNRRNRRTNIELENIILQATKDEIIDKGVAALTVVGIAKRAEIDTGVFYNRYKNLQELLRIYVKQNDYWLNPLFDSFDEVPEENYLPYLKGIFVAMAKYFIEDKSMQEIVLWELSEDNDVTFSTNQMREDRMRYIVAKFDEHFTNEGIGTDFRATASILLCAIYFLIIHKGRGTFCGIDFGTDHGRELLITTMAQMMESLLTAPKAAPDTENIARKMKLKGIDTATIVECTGLDMEVVMQL